MWCNSGGVVVVVVVAAETVKVLWPKVKYKYNLNMAQCGCEWKTVAISCLISPAPLAIATTLHPASPPCMTIHPLTAPRPRHALAAALAAAPATTTTTTTVTATAPAAAAVAVTAATIALISRELPSYHQ